MLALFLSSYLPSSKLIYITNLSSSCSCHFLHWARGIKQAHVLILAYSGEVGPYVYAWCFENIDPKSYFQAFALLSKLSKWPKTVCKSCNQPGSSLRFHIEARTLCSFHPQYEMITVLVSSKTCVETQYYIFPLMSLIHFFSFVLLFLHFSLVLKASQINDNTVLLLTR